MGVSHVSSMYWNLYFAYAMYNTFASFLQGDPLWGLQFLVVFNMGCYLTAIHLALIRIQSEASVTYVARAARVDVFGADAARRIAVLHQ